MYYKLSHVVYLFILGSCLALNLGYSGCCKSLLTPICSHKGCYCDEHCHKWNDCCSDIANINCYPIPTYSNILGKTNQ